MIWRVLIFGVLGWVGAFGEEVKMKEEGVKEEIVKVEDLKEVLVSEGELALVVAPLTKGELKELAGVWQGRLKGKAMEIAGVEVAVLKGEAGDPAVVNERLIGLRDEQGQVMKRYGAVLDAWELKGGNVGEDRKYIAAVKGIRTTVTDFPSRVGTFRAWLKSPEGGVGMLVGAGKFLAIVLGFWVLAIFSSKLIEHGLERQRHISALLKTFINTMSRRVVVAIGLVIALGTVGVNVGAALALIGGGAFILAFALQDTLSNFANGMMLIVYRPFDVGDAVEIGGVRGHVRSVSLVSTTILTFDNQKVLVPNKKVWGEVITNITGMATRRVDMLFGIGYGEAIGEAKEILERVVREHPLVLERPVADIGVHELTDTTVKIRCWPWAKTADFLKVRTEVTQRVREEFEKAGIGVPLAGRELHFYDKK